mgnify:CR=1 FL=1
MQQEYKEAMEKISLSDSDKKRIFANVKKACEESEEKVISMDEFKKTVTGGVNHRKRKKLLALVSGFLHTFNLPSA